MYPPVSASVLMVIAGALLLAAKGIFAKLLYARGVSVEGLLTLRAVISLPLIWVWAMARVGVRALLGADRRGLLGASVAGVVGYYAGAYLDFRALQLIDASLERALLFAYPVFVVIARAVMTRAWPGRRVIVAVALTYLGVVFAVGGFDAEVWRANATGAALVMMTALTFAFYLLANERIARVIGSTAFLVYAMTAATVALCVHFGVAGSRDDVLLDAHAWFLLLVMTAATNVLPSLLVTAGITRIGAQRVAIISTVGPPATIVMGVWILGEAIVPAQLAGTLLIIAGIIILETRLGAPL